MDRQYLVTCQPRRQYRSSHVVLMMVVTTSSAAAAIRTFSKCYGHDSQYFVQPEAQILIEGDVYHL